MEERGDAKLHLLSPQMHPAQGRERAGRRWRKGGGGDAGEEETVAAQEKKPSSTAAATTEPPPTRGFFSRAGRRPRARREGGKSERERLLSDGSRADRLGGSRPTEWNWDVPRIPARGRGDGWGGAAQLVAASTTRSAVEDPADGSDLSGTGGGCRRWCPNPVVLGTCRSRGSGWRIRRACCGPRWPRPSSSASIRHLPYTARASSSSGWARPCPVAISTAATDLVDCRSKSLAGAY
jgi:hypothetical protein